MARRVLGALTGSTPVTPAAPFPSLTARELEVLDLLAAGLPTAGIAARLTLSQKTVSNHVSNILVKLAVSDRTQAAVTARDAGLGRGPGDGRAEAVVRTTPTVDSGSPGG